MASNNLTVIFVISHTTLTPAAALWYGGGRPLDVWQPFDLFDCACGFAAAAVAAAEGATPSAADNALFVCFFFAPLNGGDVPGPQSLDDDVVDSAEIKPDGQNNS